MTFREFLKQTVAELNTSVASLDPSKWYMSAVESTANYDYDPDATVDEPTIVQKEGE